MLSRVVETIERHGLFRKGQRIGVAVSGGADSVCLLHVLRELAPRWELSLTVLHLDHGLRGEESREDARWVKRLAAEFGAPFVGREVQLAGMADNLEQAGREARLAFFVETIAAGAVDRVATAHTRSDQAETVLFRFLRGAGTAGLSGIRPVTDGGIVRPLLEVERDDVERYLRERGIVWREDSSNRSRTFARNRIRHDLLPQLGREWNPGIVETLAHTAEWARGEDAWWEAQIDRVAAEVLWERDGAVLLRTSDLHDLPVAVARRLVRRALERAKGDLRGIDFGHVEAVLRLAGRCAGHGRVQAPEMEIVRSFDWLRVARRRPAAAPYEFRVEVPGAFVLPGTRSRFCLELIENPETSRPVDCVYNIEMGNLDWLRLPSPLQVRNWKAGDRYQPQGSAGVEKIKVLFQKARIPLWERRQWPVLTDGASIVWARRFGPAAEFAAHSGTSRVLRVRETEGASGNSESD